MLVLVGNKFSNKVLAIGLSDGFRLRIKDVGKIIMVLLLSRSHLNERDNLSAGGEEDFRVFVNSTNGGHVFAVLDCELFEVLGEWFEAMFNIFLIGIAADKKENADQVG